jgi:hypothetical protein
MSAGAYTPLRPAGAADRRVRPSGWWFVVAAAIAVGGMVAGLVMIVDGVNTVLDAVTDFDRTDVPGTVQVTIDEPGGYSIYHEFAGAGDPDTGDLPFVDPPVPPPEVTVVGPAGEDVEVSGYDTLVTYAQGNLEGRGLYTFDAGEAGVYEVTADGAAGSGIAVGRGMGDIGAEAVFSVFGGFLGGTIVAAVGVIIGAILAIAVGVARSRSRRRSTAPPPQSAAWAPTPQDTHTWRAASAPPPADTLTWTITAPGWPTPQPGPPPSAQAPDPTLVAPCAPPTPADAERLVSAVASAPGTQRRSAGPVPPATTPAGAPGSSAAGPVPPGTVGAGVPGSFAAAQLPVPASPPGGTPSAPPASAVPASSAPGQAVPNASDLPDPPLPWPTPGAAVVREPTTTEPLSKPGDPPSLRSPHDWSRSDVEIPWDAERP